MLVTKVKSEWSPSEYRDIQVGDTVDITNPEALIVQGMVVPAASKPVKAVEKVEEVEEKPTTIAKRKKK
jgi:hypothetical protein